MSPGAAPTRDGGCAVSPDSGLALAVPATVANVRGLREHAKSFARSHGVLRVDDVALAVSEAVTNAVVHAYVGVAPGRMWLTGTTEPRYVTFVVEDHGCGPAARPDSPGLGMGLFVMTQLAQRLSVEARSGGGTTVSLSFTRTLR